MPFQGPGRTPMPTPSSAPGQGTPRTGHPDPSPVGWAANTAPSMGARPLAHGPVSTPAEALADAVAAAQRLHDLRQTARMEALAEGAGVQSRPKSLLAAELEEEDCMWTGSEEGEEGGTILPGVPLEDLDLQAPGPEAAHGFRNAGVRSLRKASSENERALLGCLTDPQGPTFHNAPHGNGAGAPGPSGGAHSFPQGVVAEPGAAARAGAVSMGQKSRSSFGHAKQGHAPGTSMHERVHGLGPGPAAGQAGRAAAPPSPFPHGNDDDANDDSGSDGGWMDHPGQFMSGPAALWMRRSHLRHSPGGSPNHRSPVQSPSQGSPSGSPSNGSGPRKYPHGGFVPSSGGGGGSQGAITLQVPPHASGLPQVLPQAGAMNGASAPRSQSTTPTGPLRSPTRFMPTHEGAGGAAGVRQGSLQATAGIRDGGDSGVWVNHPGLFSSGPMAFQTVPAGGPRRPHKHQEGDLYSREESEAPAVGGRTLSLNESMGAHPSTGSEEGWVNHPGVFYSGPAPLSHSHAHGVGHGGQPGLSGHLAGVGIPASTEKAFKKLERADLSEDDVRYEGARGPAQPSTRMVHRAGSGEATVVGTSAPTVKTYKKLERTDLWEEDAADERAGRPAQTAARGRYRAAGAGADPGAKRGAGASARGGTGGVPHGLAGPKIRKAADAAGAEQWEDHPGPFHSGPASLTGGAEEPGKQDHKGRAMQRPSPLTLNVSRGPRPMLAPSGPTSLATQGKYGASVGALGTIDEKRVSSGSQVEALATQRHPAPVLVWEATTPRSTPRASPGTPKDRQAGAGTPVSMELQGSSHSLGKATSSPDLQHDPRVALLPHSSLASRLAVHSAPFSSEQSSRGVTRGPIRHHVSDPSQRRPAKAITANFAASDLGGGGQAHVTHVLVEEQQQQPQGMEGLLAGLSSSHLYEAQVKGLMLGQEEKKDGRATLMAAERVKGRAGEPSMETPAAAARPRPLDAGHCSLMESLQLMDEDEGEVGLQGQPPGGISAAHQAGGGRPPAQRPGPGAPAGSQDELRTHQALMSTDDFCLSYTDPKKRPASVHRPVAGGGDAQGAVRVPGATPMDRRRERAQRVQRLVHDHQEEQGSAMSWGLGRIQRKLEDLSNLGQLRSRYILGMEAGDVRSKYILGKVLGDGQYGVTRLAERVGTGELYACKSISKANLKCKSDIEDLKREYALFGMLREHPHVCRLEDAFEDQEEIHFVMELCKGGDLFDRLKQRRRYTEPKAAAVMRTLLGVLAFCHELHIVHRDIKPENILLCSRASDTDVKVIDFGIAVTMKPGSKPLTELMGSPYYTAPEVIEGCYGTQADVWSAGVVLYVLLIGVPPFWAKTEGGTLRAIREGKLSFKDAPLSEAAKDMMRWMLTRDPQKRLTAQEALGHPWLRCSHSAQVKY